MIAPSLVPKGGSERVKTARRDAVRVPSPEEEVRDLVRTRADLLDDRKRMQRRG